MSNKGNTIRLHRVIKAPAERVYRAFIDSDAVAQWLPPFGFTCKVHSRDAVVGGHYHLSFTNFTTKSSHGWKGEFIALEPGKLIKYADQFDNPHMTEKMLVTVALTPVMCGTELHITQENIPTQIPTEMCYLGWQESLIKLAQLVESEIKES